MHRKQITNKQTNLKQTNQLQGISVQTGICELTSLYHLFTVQKKPVKPPAGRDRRQVRPKSSKILKVTSKLPENGFGDPRTVQKDGGRVSSYHSGNAKTNRGARRYEKTIITNVCFHRFLPILWTQTGITAMVGAPNAQKLLMFLRLILIKCILMSRSLREE